MKKYNHRIVYWGGNQNTVIPRMGACGEGVEVESGAGGGSGRGPDRHQMVQAYLINLKDYYHH